ncbi:MAG: dTMP kinase [Deltaproteobacteria bacterium]|nr:dTMP kinase [Deltaproteobacteria bacterium]
MAGFFLVLEGIDGSGTTTQAARLAARFTAAGARVVQTCEPSRGPIGTHVRQLLRDGATGTPTDPGALALLFAADRLDHLAREVEPALAAGAVVICDRYVLSSLAYQGAFLDVDFVERINARARRADLTVFVDVDVPTAAARRAARGLPADQYEVDELQARVRRNYAAFAARPALGDVRTVDGNGGMDDVERTIWTAVETVWRA